MRLMYIKRGATGAGSSNESQISILAMAIRVHGVPRQIAA